MALRTVSNTGGNWDAPTTWVGGVVPIAGDTVDFTATSGNLTVNVSTASLAGINFTNYVGTITFNNNINVNTSVNLGTGGYTQAGASGLTINATTTITTNGVTWSRILTISSGTLTLADNLSVNGTLTFTGGSMTINGNNINIGGNLAINVATSAIVSGNTNFIINGTGNQSWTHGNTNQLRNNLTINKASGTLTLDTINYYNTGILTYIPSGGTVDTTGNTLNIAASTTLNTNGITWNTITTSGTITLTLSSNLNTTDLSLIGSTLSFTLGGNLLSISNTLTITRLGATTSTFNTPHDLQVTNLIIGLSGSYTYTINGLYTIYVSGNLTENHGSFVSVGNTSITLNGTGTWSNTGTSGLQNNVTINTTGTLTIGANIYYNTGTLIYTQGVVDTTTNNSTLNLTTASTLNTNGIIWNNVSATSGTHSIASNFYCNNFSSSGSAITFNNTGGDIYLYKSLTQGVAQLLGNATIYFIGGVTWNQTSLVANHHVRNSIVIDTSETVTFGSYVAYSTGTLTYKRGKVNAKGCTFSIQTANTTLINCHKINFDRVSIQTGITVNMNEFFNGSPELRTAVSSTTTTNAIVTFTDNFEKIAKFVNINGITLTRPQQLLLLTNQPKKSRNIGIRYNNQSPNGSPKNDPSVPNNLTVGQTRNLLVGDPSFVKSI
jgi:hypothetical protein